MKVLIACEISGVVRDAFRAQGHEAWSCDIEKSDSPYHLACDVRSLLIQDWDLMIAHPPCQYLCNSGVRWLQTEEGRRDKMIKAALFFRLFLDAPIPRIAVENPVMHGYATPIVGRKQDFTIQPYQFGEDASKRTGFWLKNLPRLKPTQYVEPRITADGKKRWANQTDSGQNRLGPSKGRAAERAKTYPGIAKAIAEQWGDL